MEALADTPQKLRELVERWGEAHFERSYAPGKWTARQVIIHLAQTELALTTRVRFALSQKGYAAQAFDQDEWIAIDERADARTALDAYSSLRRLNLAMWTALTPAQRERRFTHPEYGELTVGWVMAQLAGHDIHHYGQLQKIK
jgi:uncharacterized damage-inducible protein DinB